MFLIYGVWGIIFILLSNQPSSNGEYELDGKL
jgi:hypothetical protein